MDGSSEASRVHFSIKGNTSCRDTNGHIQRPMTWVKHKGGGQPTRFGAGGSAAAEVSPSQFCDWLWASLPRSCLWSWNHPTSFPSCISHIYQVHFYPLNSGTALNTWEVALCMSLSQQRVDSVKFLVSWECPRLWLSPWEWELLN